MANRRLSMRKIKEVLRLRWELGLGCRQTGRSCSISHNSVAEYEQRAQAAGLSWPLPEDLDDQALEALLFPPTLPVPLSPRTVPDWPEIHQELRRPDMTLQLLWYEYQEKHPQGYRYSQFCELYRRWAKKLDWCLRQEHRAGEKLFVDFSGQGIPITHPGTGEMTFHTLFVAVWGASSYTYAEACQSEELPHWIGAHVRAFGFFGCLPKVLVPDNLRAAVKKACRYDPELNPTYQAMARHYGLAVIPARVGKPKDKAKVEAGVLLVERWILATLRHRTFFSLAEANQAIRELLIKLNQKPFKKLPGSRQERFNTLDQPAAQPLSGPPYEYADWLKARVNVDVHIEVEGHYYSVPYPLVREQVDVRLTQMIVEVLFKNRRVASHARSFQKGKYTTLPEHLPPSHQHHLAWTPERILRWTEKIGPCTAAVAQEILKAKDYPEQGFRACLGLIRLGNRFSHARLEAACQRASRMKHYRYQSIKSILTSGLDQQPLTTIPEPPIRLHPHIRGKDYYQ